MANDKVIGVSETTPQDALLEVLREGARRLLNEAIEAEVQDLLGRHSERRLADGRAAVAWLYLKGVSSGHMQEALQALLGTEAKGLSASMVMRLKAGWGRGVPDLSAKPAGGSELGLPVGGRHL